jgi:hypothetical protein
MSWGPLLVNLAVTMVVVAVLMLATFAYAMRTIPPDAERQFAKRMGATTIEVQRGHLTMVSHPDEVAQLITTAAEAVQAAG